MATTTKKATAKVTTKNKNPEAASENLKTVDADITVEAEENIPIKPKIVDESQYITVVNGFQGMLVYKSRKTGETFIWESFGDEQEIELKELRNAKNSYKEFFINNWFMFRPDDSWVLDYLGLRSYYKYALTIDHFDDIFNKSTEELSDIIPKLSDGQKKSIAYRAMELMTEGKLDAPISAITTLEELLGIELIERG